MRLLTATALILTALAGCTTEPVEEHAEPLLVDALAAWQEGLPSANIGLTTEWRQGGAAEIDAWGHYVAVDRGSTVHILDVADPDDIQEVSSINDAPGVLDVKWSDDGQFIFIGEDAEGSVAPVAGNGPFTGGFYTYDVSDVTAPKFVGYHEVGPRRGPHMVAYHQMADGTELVLGANADISINVFDREAGTMTEASRYSPMLTDWNRDPEVFDVLYQGWAHDMVAYTDPELGSVMVVANWDAGLRIVDINDPANPVELGAWMDFPEGHEGNLHTVAMEWIGDRRIVVGSTEVGFGVVGGYHYAQGTDRSILYVWDATDATNPTLLGFWENPDNAPSGRFEVPGEEVTSTHNLQLEEGRVYMAHYGLGVFVIDISTPAQQQTPLMVGYYQEEGMNTWDVILLDGRVWTSGVEGVLGLHFVTDVLGDAGIDSHA